MDKLVWTTVDSSIEILQSMQTAAETFSSAVGLQTTWKPSADQIVSPKVVAAVGVVVCVVAIVPTRWYLLYWSVHVISLGAVSTHSSPTSPPWISLRLYLVCPLLSWRLPTATITERKDFATPQFACCLKERPWRQLAWRQRNLDSWSSPWNATSRLFMLSPTGSTIETEWLKRVWLCRGSAQRVWSWYQQLVRRESWMGNAWEWAYGRTKLWQK